MLLTKSPKTKTPRWRPNLHKISIQTTCITHKRHYGHQSCTQCCCRFAAVETRTIHSLPKCSPFCCSHQHQSSPFFLFFPCSLLSLLHFRLRFLRLLFQVTLIASLLICVNCILWFIYSFNCLFLIFGVFVLLVCH